MSVKCFLLKLLLRVLICIPVFLKGQTVEVHGFVKIHSIDTVDMGETVIVRTSNGTLAERYNRLTVSYTGDTLYNGTNWVIVPGISLANNESPVDGDGNIYDTVHIGTQIWFKGNLRTTRYTDHSPIPNLTGNSEWSNATYSGYCWYNNSSSNAIPYGALYNFYTIEPVNPKKICPYGWHVPSDDEINTLVNFLNGAPNAGGALKEEGTSHWYSPNIGATNSSQFTAVASGSRSSVGDFNEFGTNTFFWSTTEQSPGNIYYRQISTNGPEIYKFSTSYHTGLPVRCIKD